MSKWPTIADIRREYGVLALKEADMPSSPMLQFEKWFNDELKSARFDPTAMVLSTVDAQGHPDSRVVLLKGIDDDRFIFYTNYQSAKGIQLQHTPYAALNFFWPEMSRQVRVRGNVLSVSTEQADAYFASRPVLSQLSAMVSPQSQPIASREGLEEKVAQLITEHHSEPIARPLFWGGYALHAREIEFWQGRDNRLHDRILYTYQDDGWEFKRLAP